VSASVICRNNYVKFTCGLWLSNMPSDAVSIWQYWVQLYYISLQ